jgi:hypothetical protein
MANVYVEARPKGRPEGTAIEGYVVEEPSTAFSAVSLLNLTQLSGQRSEGIVLWRVCGI